MKKINTGTVLPPINQSGSERTSPANGVSSVNEKNLNKMLVLTKTDIDRLTNHLNRKQREDEERSAEMARKRELYERSKALTSNWNNTIEGSRRHKLEQKKIREEKLENMRKQIDLEHAEYMAEERKKAIEKAKLLQYHETDRIKTFHSALKLTEVLKEREAQLELKKILENLNREQEIEMEKHNQKLLLEKDKVDDSAYQKKVEETRKLYEYNKKQIELHMEKLKESQEQRQREAEMLQEESERIALENEQLEQIRRQKSKQLKETYDKILENKQKMREAEAIMDEEENEEIRVYAGAKKKMAQIKQKRELDALKKKEDHRERMLAYLGSLLKQQVEDEDFRIAKEVAKNEARTLEEERLKEQKFKEAMDGINKHRIDTINRREKEKEEQKKEEDEMMKMKMQADYLYQMYEIEKNKKRSEKQKHVSSANLKLAKERKEVESKTKKADREFVLKDLELLDLEDKQFQEYANKVIAYMEERDRNTYPMKKVLNEAIKPSQPIEIKGEAAQIKKHQSEVPTGKNLGFM